MPSLFEQQQSPRTQEGVAVHLIEQGFQLRLFLHSEFVMLPSCDELLQLGFLGPGQALIGNGPQLVI
jgi:hypothetical protein